MGKEKEKRSYRMFKGRKDATAVCSVNIMCYIVVQFFSSKTHQNDLTAERRGPQEKHLT